MQKQATPNPGSSQRVSFTVIPTAAATYHVLVNGLTGSFTAAETQFPIIIQYQGYEVRIVGMVPSGPQEEWSSLHIYFELWKVPFLEEFWIDPPLTISLIVTRPDGSTYTADTRNCPQVNSSGDYSVSFSPTMIGTYQIDFCGLKITLTKQPLLSNIFTPTAIEMIYDSAPYCLETYNAHKSILEGDQDGYNLLAIINRIVDISLTSVDFTFSRFLSGEANDGRLYVTIYGTVKNSTSEIGHIHQAAIPLTIKLIPHDIYLQAYLETGDYTYSLRHPRYWKCPDPNYKTLFYPYSGTSRYYDTGDPMSTIGMKIATGATGSYQRTASGSWARYGSSMNRLVHDQTWVRQLLVAGDRYEVVVTAWVGLDSYLSGYDYAAYPLKFWHVGYVIIA